MRKSTRALTVVELLVSMALMSIISLVMVRCFLFSSAAVDRGIGAVDLQRRARETIARAAPLLSSAIPVDATVPAVFYVQAPAYDSPSDFGNRSYQRTHGLTDKRSRDSYILFSTTEDFLASNYNQTRFLDPFTATGSATPVSGRVWHPEPVTQYRFPGFFYYGLEWEGAAKRFVLRRYQPPNPSKLAVRQLALDRQATGAGSLDRMGWVRESPDRVQVLGHSDNPRAQIPGERSGRVLNEINFEFVRWEAQALGGYNLRIEVSKRIRNGRRQLQDGNAATYFALEQTIQCPSYNSR